MKHVTVTVCVVLGASFLIGCIWYYKSLNLDHFEAENKGCRSLCVRDCEKSCSNSQYLFLDYSIFGKCVDICKKGVKSCMDKCDGCSACA